MHTQLPPRSLLSVALSLLLLSVAWARRRCSSSSSQLLSQLQSQANITGNTESLLEHYIRFQNLDTPTLRATCTERSGAFPSEDELRRLSQHRFLSTVYGVLDSVWHQLDALKEQFPKTKTLENARLNIQGIKNNVYCLARLLRPLLEIPEPTPADSGASQPTTNTPGAFQTRIENCRFLGGYHRFMGSVGRVFSEWEDGSKRSRRHSPLRARRKGARRIRPSRSSQNRMPRAQGPR